jgi:hypothetical protein
MFPIMSDPNYASECELCHERRDGKPVGQAIEEGWWKEEGGITYFWTLCPLCRARLIGCAATVGAIAQIGTLSQIRSALNDLESKMRGY